MDQQLENMEYFNCLGSIIRIMQDVHVKLNAVLSWQKLHSTRRRLSTSKLDLNSRKKLEKCYMWSISFYDAETWTLRQTEVPGKF